ncbi:sigma-70 family RNA polymerase sigma factor [Kitasatospora sp. NPDC049258]|uniref:RNA polymerase sigma factor n=1 Tax=Kitasatospora sp. NPDC049258 TaxID=3155394 RepID=UPI003418903C
MSGSTQRVSAALRDVAAKARPAERAAGSRRRPRRPEQVVPAAPPHAGDLPDPQLETRSDAELTADVRREGDGGAALAELYRRHHRAVLAYARACCRDPHTAADLAAEGFARTIRAVRSGSGPQDAWRPYLLTVVRRAAADWAQTSRRIELVPDFDRWLADTANADGGEAQSAAARPAAALGRRGVPRRAEGDGRSVVRACGRVRRPVDGHGAARGGRGCGGHGRGGRSRRLRPAARRAAAGGAVLGRVGSGPARVHDPAVGTLGSAAVGPSPSGARPSSARPGSATSSGPTAPDGSPTPSATPRVPGAEPPQLLGRPEPAQTALVTSWSAWESMWLLAASAAAAARQLVPSRCAVTRYRLTVSSS